MAKISVKISKGKIIAAFLLAVVIGVGIYGTVIGVKDAIEEKKTKEKKPQTTTEKFELTGKKKEFSCDNFSITLTDDFEIFEDSAVPLGCRSEGIEMYVFEDDFEANSKESKMTSSEYLYGLIDPEDETIKLSEVDGVPCVEYAYVGEGDGILKKYNVLCYKGESCFWMLHFITEHKYTHKYEPYISEWIKTVEAK